MKTTQELFEMLQAAETEHYNAWMKYKKAEEKLLAICDELKSKGETPSGW